jgi:hypothetical protein
MLLCNCEQDTPDGPWTLKDKAGFIQTPQDFWNVDAADPLVHSARFFYGEESYHNFRLNLRHCSLCYWFCDAASWPPLAVLKC